MRHFTKTIGVMAGVMILGFSFSTLGAEAQSIPTISPWVYYGGRATNIKPATSTTKVLIGAAATTTNSYLETPSIAVTGLLNKTCIGTDASGNVQEGTCGSGGGAWPFTTGLTNFGVPVQATSTPEWFQNGLHASSTSQFLNQNIWSTLILKATSSALLATDVNGMVVATTSIGINYTNLVATYPTLLTGNTLSLAFGTTSSNVWAGTQTFTNASTTNFTASSYASTSKFYADGLVTCNTGNMLTWSAGVFGCEDDTTGGGGGAWSWTTDTNFGTSTNSTTTPTWFKTGMIASSTSRFADALFYDGLTSNGTVNIANQLQFTGAWTQIQASTADTNLNFKTVAGTGDIVFTTNAVDSVWFTDDGKVGIGTSTPWAKLSVNQFNGGTAPLFTIASSSGSGATTTAFIIDKNGLLTFSNASTTIVSAATLCLNSDNCITTWPTGTGIAWPWTTATNFATSTNATTTGTWFKQGLYASSTSHFGDQIFIADGSDEIPAIAFESDPDTGIFLNGANSIALTGASQRVIWDGSKFSPTGDNEDDLGGSGTSWRNLFVNNASTTQLTASGNTWLSAITSALPLADANGLLGEYAGSSCTNQFVRSLNGAGAATCATVDISADTNLAVTYPMILTNDTLSLAFGTTTANIWSALQTITNASTTNLTVSSFLTIPNAADPALTVAGQLALNTTAASSSVRFYDGTAERALFPETDVRFEISTTTTVAGTTTRKLAGAIRQTTFTQIGCNSSGGTFNVQIGDGTSSSTMVTSTQSATLTTFTTLSSNNVFNKGEALYIAYGTPSAGTITSLTCTLGRRYDAD